VVLGDSISRGFATGGSLSDRPANSWATGTNPRVRSISFRLRARSVNAAYSGASIRSLARQVELVPVNADLILIEIGTRDVCADPETPPIDFRATLATALSALHARAPHAKVGILSVFDLPAMWATVRHVRRARPLRRFCKSVTTPSGARRAAARLRGLNREIRSACAADSNCRYDNGAAARIRWARADVSALDYLHPSVAGQAKIASAVWASGIARA
jgi:lysophospholipase L1-like esterase